MKSAPNAGDVGANPTTVIGIQAASVGAADLSRIVKAGEWLVVAVALAYFCGRGLPKAWRHLNTDFPNYYLTARLQREGYSTARIYEWIWLQHQKDRIGIKSSDQPVVGFVPDTPFSALLVRPLTSWQPITAKRIWIVANLLVLCLLVAVQRSLTRLSWRRLALITGLSYPLLRNLEYGQYYLIVLLIVSLGLWAYVKGRSRTAGVLIGIAAGLKIFPGFFLLYFARKRDLQAVIGLAIGVLVSLAISVWAFGLPVHRVYFVQVLPWALRGEALDPYNLTANSISSLLHKLLLFEPEWNPHPLFHAPTIFAILHPLIQLAVLAPAILLVKPIDRESEQLQLEWSCFLIALLAISTLPASYHFTLLVLPVSVMMARFQWDRDNRSLVLLLLLYVAINFPKWQQPVDDGWRALLAVPRLYFVLLLCVLSCAALMPRRDRLMGTRHDWLWVGGLALAFSVEVAVTLHHQRSLDRGFDVRITTSPDVLMVTDPVARQGEVDFIAMRTSGYVMGMIDGNGLRLNSADVDQLAQASATDAHLIEEDGVQPHIVSTSGIGSPSRLEVADAEFPVVSPDGRQLAYLRSRKGRNQMWLRTLRGPNAADAPITPSGVDVEEMTFLPDGSIVFSAFNNDRPPTLYLYRRDSLQTIDNSEARYPAASPDGKWLAYSRLDRGVWNLWLRNLVDGTERRITNADCNYIFPAWREDSKTLIYASDCGRALWFTALYSRPIAP